MNYDSNLDRFEKYVDVCGRRIVWTKTVPSLFGCISLAALSACTSFPEVQDEASINPMEPVPQPVWTVGMERNALDLINGESGGYKVTSVADTGEIELRSKRETEGKSCTWVVTSDWFAPASSWENCGTGEWASGSQVVTHKGDNLWPLRSGAKAQYRRIPTSSTGKTGTPETRQCEVSGPVKVSIRAGEFDAMKVNCNTTRWDGSKETRIWYWNAEHGEIKYRKANSRDGLVSETETVFSVAGLQ